MQFSDLLSSVKQKFTTPVASSPQPVDVSKRRPSTSSPQPAVPQRSTESAIDEKKYRQKLNDYYLLMEFKKLKYLAMPGVYVMPAADNLRRWHGVIFLRNGYYGGAIFKFIVDIPQEYPKSTAPRIFFISKVHHPLIHSGTGELDVSPQFPNWTPYKDYIYQLLSYVKKIFYKTEYWHPRSGHKAFNPVAEKSWLMDKVGFLKECVECVRESKRLKLKNQEDSSIRFTKETPAHQEALKRILEKNPTTNNYLLWFAEGVHKITAPAGRHTAPPAPIYPTSPIQIPGSPPTSPTSTAPSTTTTTATTTTTTATIATPSPSSRSKSIPPVSQSPSPSPSMRPKGLPPRPVEPYPGDQVIKSRMRRGSGDSSRGEKTESSSSGESGLPRPTIAYPTISSPT